MMDKSKQLKTECRTLASQAKKAADESAEYRLELDRQVDKMLDTAAFDTATDALKAAGWKW